MKIFGVNLAKELAKGMKAGLPKGTLEVVTQGSPSAGALTSGANPATSRYTFSGTMEYATSQIEETLTEFGERTILILGGTLPEGVAPKPGDRIVFEGGTFNVVSVERDPAAATYSCGVRG